MNAFLSISASKFQSNWYIVIGPFSPGCQQWNKPVHTQLSGTYVSNVFKKPDAKLKAKRMQIET